MAHVPFSAIRNLEDLASHLGCEVEDIQELAQAPKQAAYYDVLKIAKRRRRNNQGKQYRTVYRAKDTRLSRIHKILADSVRDTASDFFPPCVQGFVRKRSILTNARQHLGAKQLLHADIHHFFESINWRDVVAAFECLGCRPEIAEVLGRLCTFKGFLPQGAHSSPALANLVCRQLDADLMLLATSQRCRYTRYADDITFSGDAVPQEETMAAILRKHGFKLRDGKCRLQRRGGSQFVTGLSVTDPTHPRISRKMKRNLRLVLHYVGRYGIEDHLRRTHSSKDPDSELGRLAGRVQFISSVEPRVAESMWGALAAARAMRQDEVRRQDEPD